MDEKTLELLTHDALGRILKNHSQFIHSGGKAGSWADLSLYIIKDFDFSNLDLHGIHLHHSILTHCQFVGTELSKADFDGTRARYNNFREAGLVKAEIFSADMTGSCFENANMVRATIMKSNLYGATFNQADLLGVIFSECDLRKAVFDGANLERTRFEDCLVDGASGIDMNP
ncbi:pentapeptide repeat-containing protein [Candidatus Entotheonella palauensis]|uniref:Pentapeptide repeat-containing protein n=1 Tax=Candidatus Entotheonella gemina TaxID=1429439 RepID=W4M9P6_9BACT|nr:pentapeptide repeat-containing protein [Candidatus Entotheonella palauensis]ETX06895.1 MAG: hypothetical protein ETSY2_14395 [Candidatus Entotheonella gemina]